MGTIIQDYQNANISIPLWRNDWCYTCQVRFHGSRQSQCITNDWDSQTQWAHTRSRPCGDQGQEAAGLAAQHGAQRARGGAAYVH